MGLSFSVPEGVKVPSSLVNIFKELKQDVGCSIPSHGNLEKWAVQVCILFHTLLEFCNVIFSLYGQDNVFPYQCNLGSGIIYR